MEGPFVSVCRNLFEHVAYVQSRTPGMRTVQWGDFFMVDSGLASDTFNKILCCDQLALDGDRTEEFRTGLASLSKHFSAVTPGCLFPSSVLLSGMEGVRSFTVWTGTGHPEKEAQLCAAFEQAGYGKTEEELAMFFQISNMDRDRFQIMPGVNISPVQDPVQLEAFSRILAANWSPPDRDIALFYQRGAQALFKEYSPMQLFLARVGDEPVGCGELFMSEGNSVAGLHMVAVLERWRGKGIGSAMTTALLMAGRNAGARQAVLLASSLGASVYSRQGFESCGKFFEFVPLEENILF